MVKIKGLIIFEKLSFTEKIKAAFGIYQTEIKEFNGKAVYVLKTGKYNDTVRKRFIRRNIKELAFYPETGENRNILSGEGFRLILKKNLMKDNIAGIIRKYAGSRGIVKGKLTVAVSSSDPADILKNLIRISDWLSEIILAGKKNGRTLSVADDFYKETGISVILSDSLSEGAADMLVAEREGDIPENYKGSVVCLEDVISNEDISLIKGVKLSLPEETLIDNIDDLVISELFNLKAKISKLKS